MEQSRAVGLSRMVHHLHYSAAATEIPHTHEFILYNVKWSPCFYVLLRSLIAVRCTALITS